MKIIGCDVGGTEIKGKLYYKGFVKEYKKKTNQLQGKESILNTLKDVIRELWDNDVCAIGIVTAGAVDTRTGSLVGNKGTLSEWSDFSIKEEIQKCFQVPTYVQNDANGAMIAEMESYLKQGINNAVMITLGTGVGTGLYINGKLYNGSTYQVEFGHMVLYPNGILCTCGQKGCVESYVSGTALTKMGKELIGDDIIHGSMIFDLYKNGHQVAIDVIRNYVKDLSLFLENIDKIIDPEIFIIGGGVIHSKDILLKELSSVLKDFKPIFPAVYGNDAGVRGAVLLATEGYKNEKN